VPRPLLAEITRSKTRANVLDLTSIALQIAIRVHQEGLLLQRLYFAGEVYNAAEIDRGAETKIRDQEPTLAERLISELSATEFHPENYEDEYRKRVLKGIEQKVTFGPVADRHLPAETIGRMAQFLQEQGRIEVERFLERSTPPRERIHVHWIVVSTMSNHTFLMELETRKQGRTWPRLSAEEMADVATFLTHR